MIGNLYSKLIQTGEALQSLFLLSLRLLWGWQFFISGKGKWPDISSTAHFFEHVGIPLPLVNAYLVASIETFGGLLLIAGLFTRATALPLIVTMVVALLVTEKEHLLSFFSDPLPLFAATPFTFLFASLTLFVFGSGFFSLDRLFKIEK